MDLDPTARLAHAPATRAWFRLARAFATTLRSARHDPGGLLVVGTAEHDPWHFAAHLADAARYTGRPHLAPTLVRHLVPAGAPPHLAADLSRISSAGRHETVLVCAPVEPEAPLLERLQDARRGGALLLGLGGDGSELPELSHESLAVPDLGAGRLVLPGATSRSADFDLAEHLLTVAVRTDERRPRRRLFARRG
jgi:hypothetical protein